MRISDVEELLAGILSKERLQNLLWKNGERVISNEAINVEDPRVYREKHRLKQTLVGVFAKVIKRK